MQPALAPRALGAQRRRTPTCPAHRAPAQEHELAEQELLVTRACDAPARARPRARRSEARRAPPLCPATPSTPAPTRAAPPRIVLERAATRAHERGDLGRAHALTGRVVGDALLGRPGARMRAVVGRVAPDPHRAPVVELAVQKQARAGRVAAGEPRLVEERDAKRTGVVEHARLDKRPRTPRLRTERVRIERTSTTTVACSPAWSPATGRSARCSRGRCSSSSPTRRDPNRRESGAQLRRFGRERCVQPRGPRHANPRPHKLGTRQWRLRGKRPRAASLTRRVPAGQRRERCEGAHVTRAS